VKTAIIIIAFSFFAPAFLFLLPSLRKKAGVIIFLPRVIDPGGRLSGQAQSFRLVIEAVMLHLFE